MEKEILNELINKDLSTRKIANILNCSQATVKYWLKKYNLKTKIADKLSEEELKKRNVERVTKRRKQLKALGVEYKGGQCIKCGYNKCIDALDFHHIKGKDFSISAKGYTKSWETVKKELDKCVLLCANCHREEHARTGS